MANMKSKIDLKDVFNGANSLLYQSSIIDLSANQVALSPEYDLPVAVDTLQLSQDDPTINHYKVIGLDGDWTSSASLGDMTVQMTIPTKHSDILKLIYGEDAVKAITGATINSGDADLDGTSGSPNTYAGSALMLKKKKLTGTFVIVDEERTNLFVITNIAMWAKPLYDNTSTQPFAFQLTGTIEGAGGYSLAWLKKSTPAAQGGN